MLKTKGLASDLNRNRLILEQPLLLRAVDQFFVDFGKVRREEDCVAEFREKMV